MTLDQLARGLLEKHIDEAIRDIPDTMSRFRAKEFKNIVQFKSEEDFLYGVVYGRIVFGYLILFKLLFNRDLNADESLEMQTVIVNRLREVKNAIFKTGSLHVY
jgi:hypothetical protein